MGSRITPTMLLAPRFSLNKPSFALIIRNQLAVRVNVGGGGGLVKQE